MLAFMMILTVTPNSAAVYASVFAALIIAIIVDGRGDAPVVRTGWKRVVAEMATGAKAMTLVLMLAATFISLAVAGMSPEEFEEKDGFGVRFLVNAAFWLLMVAITLKATRLVTTPRIAAPPSAPASQPAAVVPLPPSRVSVVAGGVFLVLLTAAVMRPRKKSGTGARA